MMPAHDRNYDALHRATAEVRTEFAAQLSGATAAGRDTVKRFFHLLLLECAERMTPAEFKRAIDVAREQIRKPL